MNRSVRKSQSVIVLAMFLATTIVGCDRGTANDGNKIKLVWAVTSMEEARELYLWVIEKFNRTNPNVEVELLDVSGSGKYYQKLLVMIAGRNAPDLMWMGQSFAEFASRGAFLDLTDRIATEINLKEYHPDVLDWYRFDGKQYGIPSGIDIEFIVYNKRLFDEFGVEYPEDDWTIDDFLKTAKALTVDRDGDGRTDQYGYFGNIFFGSFGASAIAPDGSRAMCNSPEMIEAIQFNVDLVYKHKVSRWLPFTSQLALQPYEQFSLFQRGKMAMMLSATYSLEDLRSRCADIDWDIVAMPVANRRAYWASSSAFLISADTQHADEAWLLFKELVSDEFLAAVSSRTLPSKLHVARKIVESNVQRPDNLGMLLDAVNYLQPFPRVPNLEELLQSFFVQTGRVSTFYGTDRQVSPERAMIEAEKRLNEIIARGKDR